MKYVSYGEAGTKTSGDLDGGLAVDEAIIKRLGAIDASIEAYSYDDLIAYLASTPLSQGSAVVEMRERERY